MGAQRRWSVWAGALVVAVLVVVGIGGYGFLKTRSAPAPTTLVALGDSFSSGEGDEAYGWDSASLRPPNTCHRSEHAYAPLLQAQRVAPSFAFRACSGAVTHDFFAANTNGNLLPDNQPEPAQGGQVDSRTRAITLTISGNDVGFAQVIEACIADRFRLYHRSNCSTNDELNATVGARMAALAGQGSATTPPPPGGSARPIHPVRDVLVELHQRAPKATIYLGNYPQLFGSFDDDRCRVGSINLTTGGDGVGYPVYVSRADAQWMNGVGRRLSDLLQTQVDQARQAGVPVVFVDVRAAWQGHGFCDSADPWLIPASGLFNVKTRTTAINASSFHPTADGQASGYLPAFLAAGANR